MTPLSFTQQFLLADPTKFVVNGRLFFYEAALTTPVDGFSDANANSSCRTRCRSAPMVASRRSTS